MEVGRYEGRLWQVARPWVVVLGVGECHHAVGGPDTAGRLAVGLTAAEVASPLAAAAIAPPSYPIIIVRLNCMSNCQRRMDEERAVIP